MVYLPSLLEFAVRSCVRPFLLCPRSSPGTIRALRVRGFGVADRSDPRLSDGVHRRPVSESAGGAASRGSLLPCNASRAPPSAQTSPSRIYGGKKRRRRVRVSAGVGQVRRRGGRCGYALLEKKKVSVHSRAHREYEQSELWVGRLSE